MASADILDDYKVDFFFLDSRYNLRMCYGEDKGRDLVLWNTDLDAADFLDHVQEKSVFDDELVQARFDNPSSYGGTEYISEAESIQKDGLFDHIEHLSVFDEEDSFNMQYFDSTEIQRSVYSADLVDSDMNAIALQAETLPECFESLTTDLKHSEITESELERMNAELENRS